MTLYSSSKELEIAIASWRRSFFHPEQYDKHGKSIASVRAGNVIGGGDWALDRIIPDCIKALESGRTIDIRSPKAVRPWQHVLEPLSGYMLLAQRCGTPLRTIVRGLELRSPFRVHLDSLGCGHPGCVRVWAG